MDKQDTIDRNVLREFGLVTGGITGGLFGLLLPWLFSRPYPLWPWVICILLVSWALLLPATLGPLYRGWMKVGHLLGWINSRIILGIMFYLVILPIALLMRLAGKDTMSRRLDSEAQSYRVQSPKPSKNHLEKPF